MKRVLLVAAFAALVLPGDALAHATMLDAKPDYRERLSSPPRTIDLRFDQYVKLLPGSVRVYTASGPVRGVATRTKGTLVVASLPKLVRGPYTVRWHALSS